jgi:hypothetical protein
LKCAPGKWCKIRRSFRTSFQHFDFGFLVKFEVGGRVGGVDSEGVKVEEIIVVAEVRCIWCIVFLLLNIYQGSIFL